MTASRSPRPCPVGAFLLGEPMRSWSTSAARNIEGAGSLQASSTVDCRGCAHLGEQRGYGRQYWGATVGRATSGWPALDEKRYLYIGDNDFLLPFLKSRAYRSDPRLLQLALAQASRRRNGPRVFCGRIAVSTFHHTAVSCGRFVRTRASHLHARASPQVVRATAVIGPWCPTRMSCDGGKC